MEKAKRARKAETPKRPSLSLRLRAPYLYPDPKTFRVTPGIVLVPLRLDHVGITALWWGEK